MVFAVLNVDCEPLWGQEAEPLQGLRVQPNLGEGILPVGQTQVHDHQTEVVGESVRDEEPRAGEVLEPDLRLVHIASVHQGESAILHFGVNVEGGDVLPKLMKKVIISTDQRATLLFLDHLLGCEAFFL